MNARLAVIALIAAAAISSCGASSVSTASTSNVASRPSSSSMATSTPKPLSFDASTRTVNVVLRAGFDPAAGRNFNGYSNGAMVISIPAGWSATVACTNVDTSNEYHSCAAVADEAATQPLFAGATTVYPQDGVASGQTATFTFTPDRAGMFRFACLVGHHELAGMWDAFKVTDSGLPSVSFSGIQG